MRNEFNEFNLYSSEPNITEDKPLSFGFNSGLDSNKEESPTNSFIKYQKSTNLNYKNKSLLEKNEGFLNNKINKDDNIKKPKIFHIEKITKLGRKRKQSNKRGKHNKFSQDNVIRKFKIQFMNHIYLYVNSLFKMNNYTKSKNQINIIKKIEPKYIKSISKIDNLTFLNSKLKLVFSQNLSTKLSNFSNDYNNKLIVRLYEKQEEKKVINFLEQTVKSLWLVYINDDSKKEYPGFVTLKDDIQKLRDNGESEAYIELYVMVARSYEDIFNVIISRKK